MSSMSTRKQIYKKISSSNVSEPPSRGTESRTVLGTKKKHSSKIEFFSNGTTDRRPTGDRTNF